MLPSRLKTRPNSLLKLSAMSLVVATLSGCGEDAKDCGGFWDKTFGREACSKSIVNNGGSQLPVNTVTVELSAKATTGKKLEIVSSIDGSVANASNQAIVTSKSRDTLLAMVDDKIYLKALKYNDTPVKLTPASTAIYLVLQLKGMIQLPDNQLPKAIAAIESHTGYKDLRPPARQSAGGCAGGLCAASFFPSRGWTRGVWRVTKGKRTITIKPARDCCA